MVSFIFNKVFFGKTIINFKLKIYFGSPFLKCKNYEMNKMT